MFGETYTVSEEVKITSGYGFGTVSLQSTRERYDSNLELVRGYIEREARKMGITDVQIEEAKNLYLKKFEIVDNDSASLLGLAKGIDAFEKEYRENRTPYAVLKEVKPEDYRLRLGRMFKPEQSFEELYEPPILFRGDDHATSALLLIAVFLFFRRMFTRKFDHSRIRYVRKIKYAPMTTFVIFTFAYFPILFLNVNQYIIRWAWDFFNFGAHLFTNSYIYMFAHSFIAVWAFITYLALWPRKLMVVGDRLVIKSLTYFSYSIPLSQVRVLKVFRSWSFRNWSFRYRFIDLAFFRKGLYIQIGRGFFNRFFFGFSRADKVHQELTSILQSQPEIPIKKVS
jgi:hypothetical protein